MLWGVITFMDESGSVPYEINNRSAVDNNYSGTKYYISVDSIDGLYSADIDYESHPIPNFTGEKSGDTFRRGKGLALTGTIWASHLGGLGQGAAFLSNMFWETGLRKLKFFPLANGAEAYLMCRVQNDVSVSTHKPQGASFSWPWTVGLRADDPIIYKVSDDTAFFSWMS